VFEFRIGINITMAKSKQKYASSFRDQYVLVGPE
jgi:hypothetical protein